MPRIAVLIATLIGAAALTRAEPERFTFEHPSPDGAETRTFEARIDRPDAELANGSAVMLIGGGNATDMDWFVSGVVVRGKTQTRVTISGEPTRDARTIGEALVGAGFVVMRWSSVHEGDPVASQTPGMITPIPFEYSVELTRSARDAFRERSPEARERLILIGHSLGAPRATAAADDGVVGLVFLAGAYTSRTKERPSEMREQGAAFIRPKDRDADGTLSRRETPDMLIELYDTVDADGDGRLCDWEVSTLLRAAAPTPDDTSEELRPGVPWPSDVIRDRRLPTLALFGGLDPISIHGGWLRNLASTEGLDALRVEFRAGLGHQLSREQDGLIGPIDPGVVERIVAWCMALVESEPAQP